MASSFDKLFIVSFRVFSRQSDPRLDPMTSLFIFIFINYHFVPLFNPGTQFCVEEWNFSLSSVFL